MADIKNFGIKGIASDVQMGKSGGRLKYDASNNRFDLTQSDGSTLEDLRIGSITSGAWTATSIGTQYGGTGQDFSSASGLITLSSGTASAANISLSNSNFIDSNSQLPVAQGGTGGTDASSARTNLGLGSLSLQASNSVDIDGGAIDGTVIGGNSPAAITGTTITASSSFVGDLTGTASDATVLETARDIGLSGDATGNVSFDGSADVNLSLTLANSGATAGSYGSTTAVPSITVDAKGRITAISEGTISTGFSIGADNGSDDTVAGGSTVNFVGTSDEIETTVSDNQIQIGLPNDVTIGNDLTVTNDLTVSGQLNSDDITSSSVSVAGDAIITGNLTVQGTTTTVNSTTVETGDAIFRVNTSGASTDAGFEANTAGGIKQFVFDAANTRWTIGSENLFTDGNFVGDLTGDVTGDLTGDVTGQVSSISNHTTTNLTEGTNLYYTTARANAAIDAFISGDTGITVTNGAIDLDDTAVTPGTYGSSVNVPTLTVDQQGSITSVSQTALSTSWTLEGDSGSEVVAGGSTATIAGGTNITTAASATDTLTVSLDSDISLTSVTATGAVEGGSLTDGTLTASSGAITGATNGSFSGTVTANALTDGQTSISLGNISGASAVTASGAITGGSLTDGSATLSSGSLTGASAVTASGAITGGSLTDGTATLSGGSLAGAVNVTASGTISFASLTDGTVTINAILDEDNFASDSATAVPTQQSVKAYVDAALTGTDLDFAGDTGGDLAVDLDSQKLTIAGGTNVNTAGSGQSLTVNLDTTLTGLTSVTSTTLTDGVATLTGGALTDVDSIETTGDVTIGGNLTVAGSTTSVNSTNTSINDTLLVLQSGLTGANPNDIGLILERGTDGDNGFLGWDQSTDRFISATTTADGSGTGDLTLTAADFEAAEFIGTSATISGTVEFGSLTDGTDTVTGFVTESDQIASNDNDATIPTSAAVRDYVDNFGGDGLLLRQALTSGSATIDTAAMPNVSSRTYYATKIVIKIGTAFSGGSFNHILVKENNGSGTTLVGAVDADAATAGSYIIELDGDDTLTKNAVVQVQFMQADGSTAATTTAGSGTISVHYNYV
jgi:hypothetical protein